MCRHRGPSVYGQRVRARREELQLSRPELAERAGIDPAVIERLERGEIQNTRTDTAVKIARALGADLNWLVGRYNESEPGILTPVTLGLAGN